jgi:hypothetical protein
MHLDVVLHYVSIFRTVFFLCRWHWKSEKAECMYIFSVANVVFPFPSVSCHGQTEGE